MLPSVELSFYLRLFTETLYFSLLILAGFFFASSSISFCRCVFACVHLCVCVRAFCECVARAIVIYIKTLLSLTTPSYTNSIRQLTAHTPRDRAQKKKKQKPKKLRLVGCWPIKYIVFTIVFDSWKEFCLEPAVLLCALQLELCFSRIVCCEREFKSCAFSKSLNSGLIT